VHLSRLEQLVLRSWRSGAIVLAKLAHPTLQEFELMDHHHVTLTEEQVHSLLHTPRLPRLASCKSTACVSFSSTICTIP
jgi:hypothetical protein